jgi:hypothetical protein
MTYLRILSCILTLFVLSGCSVVKSTKLFYPELFGMQQIAPKVYVEPAMPQQAIQQLKADIDSARGILSETFGVLKSDLELICCFNQETYQAFGGISARSKAYGQWKILLSPRGLSPTILVHELCHTELKTRLDVIWPNPTKLPAWFDEGLATHLSRDNRYTLQTWLAQTDSGRSAAKLEELLTTSDWLKAQHQGKATYIVARLEVQNWLEAVGTKGLFELIERINSGENFQAVYNDLYDKATQL